MKKKIAMFTTGWAAEILNQYLTGIWEVLKTESVDLYIFMCHATFGNVDDYRNGELNIFSLPNMKDFDAAIVFANGIDFPDTLKQINNRCKEAGIPIVYTGKKYDEHYFISSDNYVGTRELCEHLLEVHQVKNILYIAGSAENMDSNTRMNTISEVMLEHGLALTDENIIYSDWTPYQAIDQLKDYLRKGNTLPDAIVCANDTLAMVVCDYLRRNNTRVPEDVIVTGFDNEFLAQIYDPSISSVDQRFDKLGNRCGEILKSHFAGIPCEKEYSIPCEFIPSESCGCCSAKDFQAIRREIGRKKFIDQITSSNFDLKLSAIEREIMHGKSYADLGQGLRRLNQNSEEFEGETFYLVLDPLFEKTIENQQLSLRTSGYPETMDVVYYKDKDMIGSNSAFPTRDLIPRPNPTTENRLFIFLPLHENEFTMGYLVFGDDFGKIHSSQMVRKYAERVNIILGKFYRDLRVEALHNRLLQMTETDALTRVKNRTAFETRQRTIEGKISAKTQKDFALVVFDINYLKRINDNFGHEAGDEYIINCCRLICRTFKKSAVYRIGGDEFVAILDTEDYKMRNMLIDSINMTMERLTDSDLPLLERISIAVGMAVYDANDDMTFADVFNRADAEMYRIKQEMKQKR